MSSRFTTSRVAVATCFLLALLLSACKDTSGPTGVSISAISPTALQPGGTATISGRGFSPTPAENQVTIGGLPATVTTATATSLTVVVPGGTCVPGGGNVNVRVVVATNSAQRDHPLEAGTPLQVAVGQQVRLDQAASYCLSLAGIANSAYLVGVQSVTGVATSLTPAVVRGIPSGAPAAGLADAPALALGQSRAGGSALQDDRRARRRAQHREAELAFRLAERRFLDSHRPSNRLRSAAVAAGSIEAAVPPNAAVGDTVNVRYPRTPNFCQEFVPVRGVVRHIGTRGIWVEDVTNPPGGFSPAQYQSLSDQFDGHIYATNVQWFGEPTDLDNNSRIVILLSREVNRDGVLGRVFSVDFFPNDCPASNGGEIFYGIAPDPDSAIGAPFSFTVAEALEEMPTIIAHELAHVIQFGRRLMTPGATNWPTIWELEGQATLAEEVVGHSVTGRQPRQNYGFSVGWGANGSPEANWYRSGFLDRHCTSAQTRHPRASPKSPLLPNNVAGSVGQSPAISVPASAVAACTACRGPSCAGSRTTTARTSPAVSRACTGP